MSDDVLAGLAETIRARRSAEAGSSHTRQLLDGGPAKCARKFGEEAVELIVAAMSEDAAGVTAEAADVVYHLLVLLEAKGVALADVTEVLRARMATSGVAEKAARRLPT